MLSAIDSVTLDIDNRNYTLLITDNTFSLKDNESVSWSGPCTITTINKIYNSAHLILVKLADNSGHVLRIVERELSDIVRLSPCPPAVYCNSDTLIYNSDNSCYFHNSESGKQLVNVRHAVLGYDFRNMRYIFRKKNEFSELRSSKLQPYQNDCLNSVGSLPISWVSIFSDNLLILGTSLKRVMYVYDGIITSHYGLPHVIQYIAKTDDLRVVVFGSSFKTELSIPVLALCTSVCEQSSAPIGQLVQSCDNLIQNEMRNLHNLHRLYEKKTDFLVGVWNKLFGIRIDKTETFSGSKRKRQDSSKDLLPQSDENMKLYQIPRAPSRFARTSTFTNPCDQITVFCSDPTRKIFGDNGPCDMQCLKLQSLSSARTVSIEISPEFKEKLRMMFAEAFILRPNSFEVDALAHLVYIVMSIDDE